MPESDQSQIALEQVAESVVDSHEQAVKDYRMGNGGAVNYLVGQVMAESEGSHSPSDTKVAVKDQLSDPPGTDIERDDLLEICDRAMELQRPENWKNRDSPSAFQKTAILKAYLEHAEDPSFTVLTEESHPDRDWVSSEKTLKIEIDVKQREFNDFETRFYVPTYSHLEEREREDRDWY